MEFPLNPKENHADELFRIFTCIAYSVKLNDPWDFNAQAMCDKNLPDCLAHTLFGQINLSPSVM